MSSRTDFPDDGNPLPWHLRTCDRKPNEFLGRILRADRELHQPSWYTLENKKKHMGSRIMYWHRQACVHRLGQGHIRNKFLAHLERQAIFSERKKAEKEMRGVGVPAHWQVTEEEVKGNLRAYLAAWKEKKRLEEEAAAELEAQRKAEEAARLEADVRARREAVSALRTMTNVAAPHIMTRNLHGHAIHMPRML